MLAKRFCAGKGWEIVKVYQDGELSGKNTRRPGFQKMCTDAEDQLFDVVVVEAIDRLTRDVVHGLNIFRLMQFRDIVLHSINEGQQDFMKVLVTCYGAQMMAEKTGEHTRRGLQGALTRQRMHSLAYGYRKREVKTGTNRQIDPEQAKVVRRIFEQFANGKSAHTIAKELNVEGIPAPKGSSWDGSTLRGNAARQEGLLRNPLYIGIARVCKNTHSDHPETRTKKVKPTPDQLVETVIPELRIIDQPLWDAVQAELARRAASTPQQVRAARRKTNLLSGLLICGCCGAPYIIISRTSYGCREARKRACNNTVPISKKRIEKRIFDVLRQTFRSQNLRAQFEADLQAERKKLEDGTLDEKRKQLIAAQRKAQTAQANIMSAIEDGAPYDSFKSRSEALAAEIVDLTQKISEIDAQKARQKGPQEDAHTVFDRALQRMETLLAQPDHIDEANRYLSILIRKITLTPNPDAPNGLHTEMEFACPSLLPNSASPKS